MKKGFTLIELLVVIAIICLLSTLAIVALNSAKLKACQEDPFAFKNCDVLLENNK